MKDKDKVVKTAVALSDDFLLDFMDQLSTGYDYELAAAVGRKVDLKRQINMLSRLDPEKAARLAAYYPQDMIELILKNTSDKKIIDIARKALGRFQNNCE